MVQTVCVKDVFETNSYFYIDEKTGHGFLIDPGAEAEKLLRMIRDRKWTIEKILLTHGHFDHTGAVEAISHALEIPYCIHRNGTLYLRDTAMNLSAYCRRSISLTEAGCFEDGEKISLQANPDFGVTVCFTPGHTEDSAVFYAEKEHLAFVGDTIFKGSIGNAQYPGGNRQKLLRSIAETVFALPEETILLSGHTEETTVGAEKRRYGR